MDFDKVMQLLRKLHEHEVDYVLVGGVALILHGIGTDEHHRRLPVEDARR